MKFKILYVDDEIENLRSFHAVFRRDFEVLTTPNPVEALEIIANQEIHLVITDQKMPEMSGFEFLKKLSVLKPHKPPNRLMVSGYSQPEEIQEAKELYQLYDFISKPWDEAVLKAKMEDAIQDCLQKVHDTSR